MENVQQMKENSATASAASPTHKIKLFQERQERLEWMPGLLCLDVDLETRGVEQWRPAAHFEVQVEAFSKSKLISVQRLQLELELIEKLLLFFEEIKF